MFAGERAVFPVRVQSRMASPREGVRIGFMGQPEQVFGVRPEGARGIELAVQTSMRGILRPGRLTVSTRFPLTLFRAWSLLEPDAQVLVYPPPLYGHPLPESASTAGTEGRSVLRGDDDFAGIRAYRAGDSLQRISWKSSARTGKLHSKEFETPDDGVCRLDWSRVPAADPERKLSILAAWVLELSARGESWALTLPGVDLPPALGPAHRRACLAALARFGLEE